MTQINADQKEFKISENLRPSAPHACVRHHLRAILPHADQKQKGK